MNRLTERDWKSKCEGYPWNVHPVKDIDDLKYYKKLAAYEDAEEHGLLIRLPCKVGSNIYIITDDGVDIADCREIRVADEEMYIESNTFCDWISFDKIGKTVFLTEEEAEAKLAEMEGAE